MDIPLTIKSAQEGLQNKVYSSVELTQECLKRVGAQGSRVNAFVTTTSELALEQATRADVLISQGGGNPLLGIPYSLKDVFNTKGIKTTAGSNVLRDYVSPYDSFIYTALRDVGAVLLGKTNCDAFGHGSSTENSDFGVTKNPYDESRVAGGSSGGSAASLAYGAGFFSVAEDTGGSIRQPAAFCGVTGLKPTYGLVSRFGCVAYASSLDTVGPMALNCEDLGLVLNVLSTPDPKDASQVKNPSQYTAGKKLKMGYVKEFESLDCDNRITSSIGKAIEEFKNMGHDIVEVSLPRVLHSIECYYLIASSETGSNLARFDGIRFGESRRQFNEENKRRIMLGTFALSAGYAQKYYQKASQVRQLLRQDLNRLKQDGIDVLIAPVSPALPFKIGEKSADPLAMYLADVFTVFANLVGAPSLSLPCGFAQEGDISLPVGMQLIGHHFSDRLLLDLGKEYQAATDWHTTRPI